MRIVTIATGLWLALAGATWAADPVEGLWKTLPDDNGNYGHIQIAPCADKLCGVLVETFDGAGQPGPSVNIGKAIVWDMQAQGGGQYGGGKIWTPDRDKTYASTMTLSGDTLSVAGCVLGGLICRAQDWSRVK